MDVALSAMFWFDKMICHKLVSMISEVSSNMPDCVIRYDSVSISTCDAGANKTEHLPEEPEQQGQAGG